MRESWWEGRGEGEEIGRKKMQKPIQKDGLGI